MDIVFLKEFLCLVLIISVPMFILIGWFAWATQTDGWLVWFLDFGLWSGINKKYKRRGWDIPLRGEDRK